MALKPDRIEHQTDISFFMNSVAERGGVVSALTSGSGVSMDDGSAVVAYAANVSGAQRPLGVLLNDVVDYDLTRQHINWHKDEVQLGGKVTVLRQGQVTTNMLEPGATPSAGANAYVGPSGLIGTSSTGVGYGNFTAVKIGQFLSARDSDGYAKVSVNIA